MTTHDEIQELLALSAAGVLDAAGERRVRAHAAECAECAGRLETLAELAAALGALPPPVMPPGLVLRTQARVEAELAAEGDRRQSLRLAAAAGVFAWVLAGAGWYAWSTLAGGGVLAWLALFMIPAWIGGAAAALLGPRRRLERSYQ